jgi:hypothetical protein
MRNAKSNDPRLAGARPGKNEDRAVQSFNGLALLRIQCAQIQHGARSLIFAPDNAISFRAGNFPKNFLKIQPHFLQAVSNNLYGQRLEKISPAHHNFKGARLIFIKKIPSEFKDMPNESSNFAYESLFYPFH